MPQRVTFDDEALHALIESYTREAGVRNLEREIASICRKMARQVVQEGDEQATVAVTAEMLAEPCSASLASAPGARTRTPKSASPPAWPGPRSAARCSKPKSA